MRRRARPAARRAPRRLRRLVRLAVVAGGVAVVRERLLAADQARTGHGSGPVSS